MASEGFSARILVDQLTPFADRLRAGLTNLEKVLEAVGQQVVTITRQAFRDESLRVSAWAPKRDGSPATLIQSGQLIASIRVITIGATSVTVGSDKIYAAIQQLGGTIKPKSARMLVFNAGGVKVFAKKVTIPPRPFFPIDASGNFSETAKDKIAKVITDAIAVYLKA